MLQAPAERKREAGAQNLNTLLQDSTFAEMDLLPVVMPVLEARTQKESSEEVLLSVFQVLPEYSQAIHDMLRRACNDPHHLNNIQGCRCALALVRCHDGPHLRLLSESLVAMLAPLSTHRQQKVRLAIVAALANAVPCRGQGNLPSLPPFYVGGNGEVRLAAVAALADAVPRGGQAMVPQLMACWDPHSVPYAEFYEPSVSVNFFARLANDTAVPVRQAFLSMVAAWLGAESADDSPADSPADLRPTIDYGKEMAAYKETLFPYLLAALADESPAVTSEAVNALERLGAMFDAAVQEDTHSDLAEGKENCQQFDRGSVFWGMATADGFVKAASQDSCRTQMLLPLLRAPFHSRPSAWARKLVQAHMSELLSGLSGDMLGWSAGPRTRAAKLLRVCMLCWEAAIADHLQKIAPLLIKR
ncbi:hypothetical protein COCOBI_12-0380 [Coccomyxa sp. Obi]|nr:hypothetical protein COCOBI_12-0380 [Coccomyxa sp. Obi]